MSQSGESPQFLGDGDEKDVFADVFEDLKKTIVESKKGPNVRGVYKAVIDAFMKDELVGAPVDQPEVYSSDEEIPF